ncbi:MAG: FdtA/QdtA family cupin domain-containing protein [Clostridia bacterium]|nr:FdtA/QdtA family cupin domain-containing protein [Clostridia bacterium]
MINGCRLIKIDSFRDERGLLSVFDRDAIGFDAKRVFFLSGQTESSVRGDHASLFSEWLILLAGSCRVELDDGTRSERTELSEPFTALLVPPMIWRRVTGFSADCLICSVCDREHDPSFYIKDRAKYLELLGLKS